MPISHSDQLFTLIKSLSKAEKKSFTVYAKRLQDGDKLKYIQLFDLMDKSKSLDDDFLINKLGRINKTNYSNLKRHLYKQILTSLRLVHINKYSEIEVRELIDFADILYTKGLVLQCLKILDKAKHAAQKCKNEFLELDIIEKIKTIESRNITRSGPDFVDYITNEASELGNTVFNSVKLSNLRLILHAYYIKNGHIKNKTDKEKLSRFFQSITSEINIKNLSYLENIYFYQSLVWYNYIMLDFHKCFENSLLWIELMKQNPILIDQDPDLFMRGYHYLLNSAYYIDAKKEYKLHNDDLTNFRQENYHKFTQNNQITSFLYVHLSRYNFHFLNKSYSGALEVIPNTLRRINKYKGKLDDHRIMVFYFKIAFTYLMTNHADKAIEYLHKIMTMEVGKLREDIQGYTRLMFLMAHYSHGNNDQMEYLIQNTKTYFNKMKETSKMQTLTLEFFNKLCHTAIFDRGLVFAKFKKELDVISKDYYEQKAFLYLDMKAWVEKEDGVR